MGIEAVEADQTSSRTITVIKSNTEKILMSGDEISKIMSSISPKN